MTLIVDNRVDIDRLSRAGKGSHVIPDVSLSALVIGQIAGDQHSVVALIVAISIQVDDGPIWNRRSGREQDLAIGRAIERGRGQDFDERTL